jgi:hypothetical protein
MSFHLKIATAPACWQAGTQRNSNQDICTNLLIACVPASGCVCEDAHTSTGSKGVFQLNARAVAYLRKSSFVATLCVLCLAFCTSAAHAGWYGGELLSLDVGGRASGMGSAYTAIADDGFCPWLNPAGIEKNKGPWVVAMYSLMAELNEFDAVGIGYPGKRFGYAISVVSLGIDSIPEFPDTLVAEPIGFFSDRELAALASCAYRWNEKVQFGVNLKHISYRIYDADAVGWGIDLGVTYRAKNVSHGLAVKDIGGTRIKWNTDHEDFRQTNVVLGTAFSYGNLLLSIDVGYEYGFLYRIGTEYSLMNMLFLRIGLNESVTAGAGIRIKNVDIDYAFSDRAFGLTHKISASFYR